MERPNSKDYFKSYANDGKEDRPYDFIEELDKYIDHLESKNDSVLSDIIDRLDTMIDKRSKIRAKGYSEDEWRVYQMICDEEKQFEKLILW